MRLAGLFAPNRPIGCSGHAYGSSLHVSWAYLFSACYRGACTLSLPPLLYYLQLAAEPLLYVAIALVLDMW